MFFNYSGHPYLIINRNDCSFGDSPQIIFAPNGAGKTTLYNILLSQNEQDTIPFTYDNGEVTYKAVEGKKKNFVIDPTPSNYSDVLQRVAAIKKEITIRENLKSSTKFSTKQSLTNNGYSDSLVEKMFDNGIFSSCSSLTTNQREQLQPLLHNQGDLMLAIEKYPEFQHLENEEKEKEAFLMAHKDIGIAFGAISLEKHREEIEQNGCPFCGQNEEGVNVFNEMVRRQNQFNIERISLLKDFNCFKGLFDTEDVLETIDAIIDGVSSLTDEQIVTLLYTNGDQAKETELTDKINSYNADVAELQRLETLRNNAFSKMQSAYSYIKTGFETYYPGCSLALNTSGKTVEVSLPRYSSSYSEGEKHEMYATIRQLTALGSDKRIILVDDPLTDLDAANQYQSVFRFIDLAVHHNKVPVIFTCNAAFVNIATEQHANCFSLYYVDSNRKATNIEVSIIDLSFFGKIPEQGKPYVTLANTNVPTPSSFAQTVLSVISNRTIYYLIDETSRNAGMQTYIDEASKMLHYHSPYHFASVHISNDDLFNYADSFTAFSANIDFGNLISEKVALLASMRVYIEKKLYEYDQQRILRGLPSCLNGLNLTKEKIIKCDSVTDYPIGTMYANWDKKQLMRLKTALNDVDHPFSMVYPLHFAMSMNRDNIIAELNAIKLIFN